METASKCRKSALILLALSVFFVQANNAEAARLVRAKITFEGKTILEGSTSDNGRPDADDVWEYLKTIKFKATEDFVDLDVEPNAKDLTLSSDAQAGQINRIVVEVAYGGMAFTRELKLIRVPMDKQGREWSLDPREVDRMFDRRFIRRSDAARLDNPKKSKR